MADEPETLETEEEGPGVTVEVATNPQASRMSDEEMTRLSKGPADDEVKQYNKSAQNSIKALRAAFAEQRRRADQFQQDASTAQGFAQQLYQENERLRANVNRSETALVDQALARAETQVEQAKGQVRAAHTAQDADMIAGAHEALARSVAEVDRLKLLKPMAGEAPAAGPVQSAAPSPPAPSPQTSERTRRWIEAHPWFGRDQEMTAFALRQDKHLELDGITEATNPDLYWRTIEARLAEQYPEKFSGSRPPERREATTRPASVTGSQRTNGSPERSGRRAVQLSESELRLAKSLGVTPERYAIEKLRKADEEDEKRRVQ
jgi:hypothetical protein